MVVVRGKQFRGNRGSRCDNPDNFSIDQLTQAVAQNQNRAKLEASGGIEDGQLVRIAETGVDYISVGALTKHCRAVDLSLLVDF